MGNCCGLSSKSEIMQQEDYIPPEDPEVLHEEEHENRQSIGQDELNQDEHEIVETATSQANTPFLVTPSNEPETTKMMMLPLVDPRLVSLLDFFRQLYVRRTAIFDKIIPVHRQDFETIFGQMKSVEQLEKKNSKVGGMIRQRSMSFGDADDLRLRRFKVKPIDSGGLQPPKGDQGGGGSKPAGSK